MKRKYYDEMIKGRKWMLLNIIDRSDKINHFDRIISNQTIEYVDTNIICLTVKNSCKAWFTVSCKNWVRL